MSCPRSTTSTESAANLFARVGLSASCCVSGAGKRSDGAPRSPIAGTHDAEVAFGSIASPSYFWLMSGLPATSEAAVIRSHHRPEAGIPGALTKY